MYAKERANLVARNAMGSSFYMRSVRQQFHGAAPGDNTDEVNNDEAPEASGSETPTYNPNTTAGPSGSGENGPLVFAQSWMTRQRS